MKSLTVIEKTKLDTVKNLIQKFKTQLIEAGLTESNILNKLKSTIFGDTYSNFINQRVEDKRSLEELLAQFFSNKQYEPLFIKLRKIQANLHIQMSFYKDINSEQNIQRKKSEGTAPEKIKKQKKQKKQKNKSKNISKNTQNSRQNDAAKISILKKNQSNSQLLNIFGSKQPLKPLSNNMFASPPNPSLLGNNQSLMTMFMQKRIIQKPHQDEKQVEREQLKRNLRQINTFKQFIQKQMLLEVLNSQGEEDSIDVVDFGKMLVGGSFGSMGMGTIGFGQLR